MLNDLPWADGKARGVVYTSVIAHALAGLDLCKLLWDTLEDGVEFDNDLYTIRRLSSEEANWHTPDQDQNPDSDSGDLLKFPPTSWNLVGLRLESGSSHILFVWGQEHGVEAFHIRHLPDGESPRHHPFQYRDARSSTYVLTMYKGMIVRVDDERALKPTNNWTLCGWPDIRSDPFETLPWILRDLAEEDNQRREEVAESIEDFEEEEVSLTGD